MDSKARHLIHVLAPLVLVSTLIPNTCAANQPSGYTQVSLGGTVAFDRSAHGTTCTNGHGRQHGSAGAPDTGPGGQFLYPVLPIGGNRDNADNDSSDLITNGYVDSDPSFGAFADHMCSSISYDGHRGTDIDLTDFGKQDGGVPVFAARAGTVVLAVDGNPDRNLSGSTNPGNRVYIDHGNGEQSEYWHLKLNSVLPSVGQIVAEGEQIGMVGSSGNSFWPHLHFELLENGIVKDAYAGPCRTGPSHWERQEPINHITRIVDWGVTTQAPTNATFYPHAPIPENQIPLTHSNIFPYLRGQNLPANSSYTFEFIEPNGSLHATSGPWSLNNPRWRSFGLWFNAFVSGMHSIPGTWEVVLYLNGQQVVRAPVEVVTSVVPFNRPPEPINAYFDPAPQPDRAPYCRVDLVGPLWFDDPDWDLVRYRYVWKVNGASVRDVTTAGLADALSTSAYQLGDSLECTITPTDGLVNGPSATIQASIVNNPWTNLGHSKFGANGVPYLEGIGSLAGNSQMTLQVRQAPPNSLTQLSIGFGSLYVPFFGGTLVPRLDLIIPVATDANGDGSFTLFWPAGLPAGIDMYAQVWGVESLAPPFVLSASNGVRGISP